MKITGIFLGHLWIALLWASPASGQITTVVDNFELGLGDWKSFGVDSSLSTSNDAHGGSTALSFSQLDTNLFGGTFNTNFTDWSSNHIVSYWVKSDLPDTSNTVVIQILEASTTEQWEQKIKTIVSTNYQKVDIELIGNFGPDPYGFSRIVAGGNAVLDLDDISQITFVIVPTNPPILSTTISYLFDDLEISTFAPLPSNVLYNFEGAFPVDWNAIGTAGSGFSRGIADDPLDVHSGGKALKFSHNQASNVIFGGVFNMNDVPITNWQSYSNISYWVKTSLTNSPNTVQIEFFEGNGDTWVQRNVTIASNAYQKVEVALDDSVVGFKREGGDLTMDLSAISQVNFIFLPLPPYAPSNVCYFIDDVALSTNALAAPPPAPTTLIIAPASIHFGDLQATSGTNRRFSSPTATCAYFTAETAWRIEVSTTNILHQPGLVSANTNYILLKFHQPNFGGGSTDPYIPPSPNVDTNWSGGSAVYKFVFDPFDDGTNLPGSDGFVSTFASNGISPDADSTPFSFAVDIGGAAITTYIGDVLFDFVVE